MTIVDFKDDGCTSSSLDQQKLFHDDLKKARLECEKAGVGWPTWSWNAGVDLVGSFVLFDGDLYKVMVKTPCGFYADAIHYEPNNGRADENGFVHSMGKPIPPGYNPFYRYYCESDQNSNTLNSGTQYVQLSLFDFN